MNLAVVNNISFGANLASCKSSYPANRKLLKTANSKLKPLAGPKEKEEAKKAVLSYIGTNIGTGIVAAQFPVADEIAMAGVEVMMAHHIFNRIYGFDLSKTRLKSIAAGCMGTAVGTGMFKVASKTLTWIPLLGNCLNAAVAGVTTAMLAESLIEIAEQMDTARRRGEKIDEIIKKLEEGKNP